MNIKSLLTMIIISLLFVGTAIAAGDDYCDDTTNTSVNSFTNVVNNTWENFTYNMDQQFVSVSSIVTPSDTTIEKNQSKAILIGDTVLLTWVDIDTGTASIVNASGTVFPVTGTVTSDNTSDANFNNGNNWTSTTNLTDSNFSTRSARNYSNVIDALLYTNWTTPLCASSSSRFVIKGIDNSSNGAGYAIPAACWNSTVIQLMVNYSNSTDLANYTESNVTYSCYNGSAYENFSQGVAEFFYEAGMSWEYTGYTFDYTAGSVTWDGCWNNTSVYILYNKTFVANVTDLTDSDYTFSWETGSNTGWGNDTGWRVLVFDLNGTSWEVTDIFTERTCTVRTGCQNTRNIIFAGFGLLAILAIVGAAMLIINIFRDGQFDQTSLLLGSVTIIGLGVVLVVGYYVIGVIAQNVC